MDQMSDTVIKVLIVGVGQLGLRYLEGLAKFEAKLEIVVVDSSLDALDGSKKFWLDLAYVNPLHKITWQNVLNNEQNQVGLAIISTSSLDRLNIIQEVASKMKPAYWILEKLLAQSSNDLVAMQVLTKYSKGVWVNTSRRAMRWHQQLKYQFANKGPLKIKIAGGLWGLACNSIHFIDLASWWSEELLVDVDVDHLDPNWFESKRPGYYEVTGEVLAIFSKGTRLELSSNKNVVNRIMQIETSCGNIWQVDEIRGVATSLTGDSICGHLEFQSELTGSIVSGILESGTCDLPTLLESSSQHAIFLDRMLAHWNKSNQYHDKVVPIT